MKSRVARLGAAFVFAIGLLGLDLVTASAAQVNVSTACNAFTEAQAAGFDGDSLAALSSAAEVAVVPAAVLDAIAAGDQEAIGSFFTDACVDPEDTTGSACLLYNGLSTDDADSRAVVASQLRFVLDNAASQIIADSLDDLSDPSLAPAEPLSRIDTVFTAACSSVDLPTPSADTAVTTDESTSAPEPTATPEPEPTATPEPEATATPEPEPTATPEPEAEPTATPEPTATSEPEATATATAPGSTSTEDAPPNLPQTGPGDFTLGLAKTATIILAAGLFFLALEGQAHFRGRRTRLLAAAPSPSSSTRVPPPPLPALTPSAEQGGKADLGTLADVRYKDRRSDF